ncbi:alpha/beta fold hydrolase [Deinococcus yavapaiensis]|uniref:Alpha-beta hydrolase superfamily lysophospholipase n=1 Tax=Deinococcus yavapaiensis KR-236 TaxID=694435 RepID=A0A318S7R7_9DEIO|nr:alpha/beta fold hydrolase [Deinococcus yavapaiensis]PYE53086.1 alpha-beta hydrolase superfamily lysophospholipase [Deinococcus yavapaiensis KR-236]
MKPRVDVRRVDGLLTHALVYGAGEPLVIVPGIGCAAYAYRKLAVHLSRHFEVWCYDPPGHGRSEARAFDHITISRLSDHLRAWLDAANLNRPVIVGHSLGGEVAIDLAGRFPDALGRLVLLAPTGVPENPSVPLQLARLMLDAWIERPTLLSRLLPAYVRCGPLRIALIAEDQRVHETEPQLVAIRAPVLVMAGTFDVVISSHAIRTLCAFVPDVRSKKVPGPHAFWYSRVRIVTREIVSFVHDAAPSPTS